MTTWTPISREKHASAKWRSRENFHFAADYNAVEVLIAEIPQMLPHYVLGFIESAGGYQLAALLGLGGDKNLYLNNSQQWMCEIVPASLRGYPFALIKTEGQDEKILCIDQDYLTDSSDETPIFLEAGDLAEGTSGVLEFLQKCDQERIRTAEACSSLSEAGLLEPWPISIQLTEGEDSAKIEGLYRIDEERLYSLSDSQLASIRDSKGLLLAYSQLLSINQLNSLGRRAEILGAELVQNEKNKQELAAVFSDDSGTINFESLDINDPQ
ncbi:MAG: hypothetical protein PsegKO_00520 [Pseudohongiellaceae bacterium]